MADMANELTADLDAAMMRSGMEPMLAAWPERRILALRVRLLQVATDGEPWLLKVARMFPEDATHEVDAALCLGMQIACEAGDEHMREVWARLTREPEAPAPLTTSEAA